MSTAFAPPSTGWRLASFGQRAAAAVIDGVILVVLAGVVFAVLSLVGVSLDPSGFVGLFLALFFGAFLVFVASLLVQPVWMARTNGQTAGKQAMRIRVVRVDGQPMTFGYAFLREALVKNLLVGFIASATFGIAYLVDLLWPLWDEERRALHDFVVRTRVVGA